MASLSPAYFAPRTAMAASSALLHGIFMRAPPNLYAAAVSSALPIRRDVVIAWIEKGYAGPAATGVR